MNELTVQDFNATQELAIRETNRLMTTMAIPKELQNRPQDVHTLVNLAMNMGIPTEAVIQNTHVVHGKIGFDAKFLIAMANRSGRLDRPLAFVMDEQQRQWCYAVGLIGGHEYLGPIVTMEMAQQEGWTKNAKWRSMPGLMLRYRAAAFFVRTVIPEVMMGFNFADELEDIQANREKEIPIDAFAITETEAPTEAQIMLPDGTPAA